MPDLRSSYRYLCCLLILVCQLVLAKPVPAESGEHLIKTAMIYNMIRFMDWPEDALPDAASQFTICVAGKGRLGAAVDGLQGKQVKGKTIIVRQHSPTAGSNGCHLLVLSDLDQAAIAGLLERTRTSAVATVADNAGFARSGGTVGFKLQNGKVRFEINQAAAQRHRIRISAQLLKLAQIVQETP
jgi:hypothetical protein